MVTANCSEVKKTKQPDRYELDGLVPTFILLFHTGYAENISLGGPGNERNATAMFSRNASAHNYKIKHVFHPSILILNTVRYMFYEFLEKNYKSKKARSISKEKSTYIAEGVFNVVAVYI